MPLFRQTLVRRRPKNLLTLEIRHEISVSRMKLEEMQLPGYVKTPTCFEACPLILMEGGGLSAPGRDCIVTFVFMMLNVRLND